MWDILYIFVTGLVIACSKHFAVPPRQKNLFMCHALCIYTCGIYVYIYMCMYICGIYVYIYMCHVLCIYICGIYVYIYMWHINICDMHYVYIHMAYITYTCHRACGQSAAFSQLSSVPPRQKSGSRVHDSILLGWSWREMALAWPSLCSQTRYNVLQCVAMS